MPKLDKLTVTLKGLLAAVADLVGNWRPPRLKNEVAYRDHLLAFIRESVPDDTKVEKEFRHRGTTMDLWLCWKGILLEDEVGFEIKVNLKKKTDFDRLVGQLEGMNPSKRKTILVLVGDTDDALLGRLKEKYASCLGKDDFTATPTLAIVCAPIA